MKNKNFEMLISMVILGSFLFLVVPLGANLLSQGGLGKDNNENEDGPVRQVERKNKIDVPKTVDVWISEKGKVEKVDLEEYVCCVTSKEMPMDFHEEALKSQAVAARTYAVSKILSYDSGGVSQQHPQAALCDTTHCQVYSTENMGDKRWKKVKDACRKTCGQLLYYGDELVSQPLFFSSSGGQTENSEDVFVNAFPYLVSVASPYEDEATHRNEEKRFTYEELRNLFSRDYPNRDTGNITSNTIKVISRTAGGRVSLMQIGDGREGTYEGTQVRSVLGLSSSLFSTDFVEEGVVFTSSGSGHGVGMSQYGANGMAKEGYDYKEILTHYYSGTEVY